MPFRLHVRWYLPTYNTIQFMLLFWKNMSMFQYVIVVPHESHKVPQNVPLLENI